VKLRHLTQWNQQRRAAAERYDLLFAGSGWIVTPFVPSYSRPIYHLYVIRTADRVGLQVHLTKAGIGSGIHYPIPLHLQTAYVHLGYRSSDFPVAERQAHEILSLPMYPQLQEQQQGIVVEGIVGFIASPTSTAALA
jgi:dTDP-4-amino-4,6-dideoxygalactose transaminase